MLYKIGHKRPQEDNPPQRMVQDKYSIKSTTFFSPIMSATDLSLVTRNLQKIFFLAGSYPPYAAYQATIYK